MRIVYSCPGLTGSALIIPLRPSTLSGRGGNFSTSMPSTALTIKLCQVRAAVLLAPQVGVLSSLPSQTPVTSWGI